MRSTRSTRSAHPTRPITSLEAQLSSGLSINSPSNNPAGYITAQGFTSQLNGITQAISNANQGVSLLQTAQGALSQQIGVVQSAELHRRAGRQRHADARKKRSRCRAVASQLVAQVSTIANQTQFNNINLLDGSFTGVQLQVGANEGQTMSLSIGNTNASAIGMYTSTGTGGETQPAAAGLEVTGPLGYVTAGAPATGTGAFAASATVTWTGANGGSGTLTTKANADQSAATLASLVNQHSATTGVSAQAITTADFAVANAVAGSGFSFTLNSSAGSAGGVAGATGVKTAVTVSGSTLNALVTSINNNSTSTGVSATVSSSGGLQLSQSSGNNILITNTTAGSFTPLGGAAINSGAASATVQGQVQFQSSAAFTIGTGAAAIGTTGTSTLQSLANINVSTPSGANQAINVVKYALQGLNKQGGNLGAVQQALTANINNLNTTSQNVTTALGTVQDANIPQVSQQLTEAQIQAQAGVAALKASTQLQQSYTSLLP